MISPLTLGEKRDVSNSASNLPSPILASPKRERGRYRWVVYLVGVPTIGICYHSLYYWLAAEAQGIADSANPVLSPLHGIALSFLNFPMMYLWFPIGEWLKPHVTDDGVFSLFAKINALVWGFLVTWVACFVFRFAKRKSVIHGEIA